MPTHLPPDEMIADYASGATSPGMSLLMAAHMTQSPETRAKLHEFEQFGGVLLSEEPMVAMSDGALDAVLSKLDGPSDAPLVPTINDGGPLPRPVLDQIGRGFDDIPWKFRLPGVSSYDFDGYGDETVQLLRARPGATVPQHTHQGSEVTLVMQGVLMDDGVEYCKGDVAVNDEHDDHRPKVLGDEMCYCLIVQQGSLRFTGTFSRVLNLLGE